MKAHLITPTNNLVSSLTFYQSLRFKVLSENDPTVVTDGKVIVEIDPNRFVRPGIKVYTDTSDGVVEELRTLTTVLPTDSGHLLQDPTGTTIYLADQPCPFDLQEDVSTSSILGNFAGISLETVDPEKTIQLYKALGFNKVTGDITQGWITLTNNDGLAMSIMKINTCPHLFFNPSFTYFNGGNNLAVIEKVRQANIPINEEITHFNSEGVVDNIIIRDPGGFGFFVFND